MAASCVKTTLSSRAAHSRTEGSSAPRKPTSCTRTMSRSGLRRKSPRTMSSLKFSSETSRSMIVFPCKQPFLNPALVKALLVLLPHNLCVFAAFFEITFHLSTMLQVITDGRIHIRQRDGWILLGDLFGSGSPEKGAYYCVQRDARSADFDDAVHVCNKRGGNGLNFKKGIHYFSLNDKPLSTII